MRYQQNIAGRKIAVLVLSKQQWPELHPYIHLVVAALEKAKPGSYVDVEIPDSGGSQ